MNSSLFLTTFYKVLGAPLRPKSLSVRSGGLASGFHGSLFSQKKAKRAQTTAQSLAQKNKKKSGQ